MSTLKERLFAEDQDLAAAYEANALKRQTAQKLRAMRMQARLTQDELAVRSGISQSQISKMESAVGDIPTTRMMQRYAAACGFDLWLSFAPKGAERLDADRDHALVLTGL